MVDIQSQRMRLGYTLPSLHLVDILELKKKKEIVRNGQKHEIYKSFTHRQKCNSTEKRISNDPF